MPSVHSSPFHQMENPSLVSLLHHTTNREKRSKTRTSGGGIFRMFKLLPMLTSGCKMVALLGRPRKPLLADHATTGTLFGYRRGRVSLAIQEDPHRLPVFVIELPMSSTAFQKEMASDIVRLSLESETKTNKKRVLEEFVWGVYCNGRKYGYSIRRKNMTDDELHVMQSLRGVSMGAGVLPPVSEKESTVDGELTYMRARFERVVGSKDSEAFHMINPEGAEDGQELSIFFVIVGFWENLFAPTNFRTTTNDLESLQVNLHGHKGFNDAWIWTLDKRVFTTFFKKFTSTPQSNWL